LNSACSLLRCSGVAPRHCGPTAERVTTSKLTCGMTFSSTMATMRLMSPAWMALSALAVLSTSVEIWRTRASGVPVAQAGPPATRASRSEKVGSSFFSTGFLSDERACFGPRAP
jgi:hypothetical protein